MKGIARNLTYAEIGAELGCAEATVRSHVRAIALILDEPRELAPRWRIYMYMKHREWAKTRPKPDAPE